MATRHGFTQWTAPAALGLSLGAQLLVDIDLAFLGSPAEPIERDDQDARKEYAWVPGFLDRPQLYLREYAVALLEAQARINPATALWRPAQ